MAMHCFFVQILPDDAQIVFQDEDYRGFTYRTRKIACASTCLQKDWDSIFRVRGFTLAQSTDDSGRICRTVNACVDFFVEMSKDGGTYLTLMGGYSCYETAITVIADVVKTVAASVEKEVKLFAHGVTVQCDEIDVAAFLQMQFEDGHQAYRKLYPDDCRVIAPSQFGKRPRYLRKFLVKCLKKGEK